MRPSVVHSGNVAAVAEVCSGTAGIAAVDTVVHSESLVCTCLDGCMTGAVAGRSTDAGAGAAVDGIGGVAAAGAAAGTAVAGTVDDASLD